MLIGSRVIHCSTTRSLLLGKGTCHIGSVTDVPDRRQASRADTPTRPVSTLRVLSRPVTDPITDLHTQCV
jgi:hypothetical protein